jgi:multisubunit Na+/H+ antiporter MnhB subunit
MAKRHSTSKPRFTARIAPSWLAAIGLALSVTSMWQPRMLASAGGGQRLVLNLPTWTLIGLAAAAVAMSLAIVSVLIRAPLRKDPDEFNPRPRRRSAATFLALLPLLVVSIAGGVAALHLLDVTSLSPASWLRVPPMERGYAPTHDMIDVPTFDFALTLTLGAVTAVIAAFALLVIVLNQPWAIAAEWLSRSRERKNSTLVAGLTSAMSTGIHELEVGNDPRSVVIACYRRCEVALELHRRGRYASETPREFVHEAFVALKLPALAVQSLLQVFEKARFSELPVTSSDRSAALGALGGIRSALERRRADGAQP